MYDIRTEAWIPFRRRSGLFFWGRVADLVGDVHGDPVTSVATPRPEFGGAVLEFIVGALSAAMTPVDEGEWRALWASPPSVDELGDRLSRLPNAFSLDGDGPRFLQDLVVEDFANVETLPIDRLLFDTPGDQTVKLNRDLFTKRSVPGVLGYPAATMALLTMQSYAPSGGQGHRTSMRGGGPMTTLVDPRLSQDATEPLASSLWRHLWANVETIDQWSRRTPGDVESEPGRLFPWLLATRTSGREGGRSTTPLDGHPLQAYFGMPRRIRLEFAGPGVCSITGLQYEKTVVGFRTRNFGVNYESWRHPLSPHYRPKAGQESLPRHPQPDGLAWSDWAGLLADDPDGRYEPAQVVGHFAAVRGPALRVKRASVRAFGVDFDNMKCRGWLDARLPIFVCSNPADQQVLYDAARSLTAAADFVVRLLVDNVKAGLFPAGTDVQGDFSPLRREFWEGTASSFYETIETLAQGAIDEEKPLAIRRAFLSTLSEVAQAVFDRWCSLDATTPESLRRVVKARYSLMGVFIPATKVGAKLLGVLGLPVLQSDKPPRKAGTRKEKA